MTYPLRRILIDPGGGRSISNCAVPADDEGCICEIVGMKICLKCINEMIPKWELCGFLWVLV